METGAEVTDMDFMGGLAAVGAAITGWVVFRRFRGDRSTDSPGPSVVKAGTDAATKAADFAEDAGRAVTGAVAGAIRTGGEYTARGVGGSVDAIDSVVGRVVPGGHDEAEADAPSRGR